jgi:hypothetical protein
MLRKMLVLVLINLTQQWTPPILLAVEDEETPVEVVLGALQPLALEE